LRGWEEMREMKIEMNSNSKMINQNNNSRNSMGTSGILHHSLFHFFLFHFFLSFISFSLSFLSLLHFLLFVAFMQKKKKSNQNKTLTKIFLTYRQRLSHNDMASLFTVLSPVNGVWGWCCCVMCDVRCVM
jgi:hypothetical protein